MKIFDLSLRPLRTSFGLISYGCHGQSRRSSNQSEPFSRCLGRALRRGGLGGLPASIHDFEPDSGPEDIEIHGRVVDFESCASWNRCVPVEGLKVRLHHLPDYVSEPTDRPGRFALPSPPAHEDDIIVDPGTNPNFARTLNPLTAPAAMSDVYGIELFGVPIGVTSEGSESILSALAREGIDLAGTGSTLGEGGYLGQVLTQDEAGVHAVAEAEVEVQVDSDWPRAAAPRHRLP